MNILPGRQQGSVQEGLRVFNVLSRNTFTGASDNAGLQKTTLVCKHIMAHSLLLKNTITGANFHSTKPQMINVYAKVKTAQLDSQGNKIIVFGKQYSPQLSISLVWISCNTGKKHSNPCGATGSNKDQLCKNSKGPFVKKKKKKKKKNQRIKTYIY